MDEDEMERLRELADGVRDAWIHMLPEWRMAVRAQSEELYNALGALSTFVSTRGGA